MTVLWNLAKAESNWAVLHWYLSLAARTGQTAPSLRKKLTCVSVRACIVIEFMARFLGDDRI